jgi:hypothetical protein
MDLMNGLLPGPSGCSLLDSAPTLDAFDVGVAFPTDAGPPSEQTGESVDGTDLWRDAFGDTDIASAVPVLSIVPTADSLNLSAISPDLGPGLSVDGGECGKEDEVDDILSFSDTVISPEYGGFSSFSLERALSDAGHHPFHQPPPQENRQPSKGAGAKSGTRNRREQATATHNANASKAAPSLVAQPAEGEDMEDDVGRSHAGRPRDKTTQRKLRNKESARRYREKQVAKRRQLENFTRSLADQNQQLELLHDKLLSLTCGHTGGRQGLQVGTGPLQDINK